MKRECTICGYIKGSTFPHIWGYWKSEKERTWEYHKYTENTKNGMER